MAGTDTTASLQPAELNPDWNFVDGMGYYNPKTGDWFDTSGNPMANPLQTRKDETGSATDGEWDEGTQLGWVNPLNGVWTANPPGVEGGVPNPAPNGGTVYGNGNPVTPDWFDSDSGMWYNPETGQLELKSVNYNPITEESELAGKNIWDIQKEQEAQKKQDADATWLDEQTRLNDRERQYYLDHPEERVDPMGQNRSTLQDQQAEYERQVKLSERQAYNPAQGLGASPYSGWWKMPEGFNYGVDENPILNSPYGKIQSGTPAAVKAYGMYLRHAPQSEWDSYIANNPDALQPRTQAASPPAVAAPPSPAAPAATNWWDNFDPTNTPYGDLTQIDVGQVGQGKGGTGQTSPAGKGGTSQPPQMGYYGQHAADEEGPLASLEEMNAPPAGGYGGKGGSGTYQQPTGQYGGKGGNTSGNYPGGKGGYS